ARPSGRPPAVGAPRARVETGFRPPGRRPCDLDTGRMLRTLCGDALTTNGVRQAAASIARPVSRQALEGPGHGTDRRTARRLKEESSTVNQPRRGARRRTPDAEALALHSEYRRTRDPRLRDRLVIEYAGVVKHIVYRKIRELPAWCEVDDLLSCGLEALIAAVDRFD